MTQKLKHVVAGPDGHNTIVNKKYAQAVKQTRPSKAKEANHHQPISSV